MRRSGSVRVCLVYDCLFPHTVGGAERWYRNLAERLVAAGHEVTYLTLRQWDRHADAGVDGVEVRAVGPRMALYTAGGRRRILPPLVFGAGVLGHLLRRGGSYDVVHTASFPYFSLLAAAVARRAHGFRLVVDWHEVWSREYWSEYLGALGGRVGEAVQRACLHVPQRAFCFSHLHAARLREGGVRGELTVLEGEYAGALEPSATGDQPEPLVLFAGRHIPEKRVPDLVLGFARAREHLPELRCEILGDGPDRQEVLRLREQMGLEDVLDAPGFVESERVERSLQRALCMVLPSRREGYGMVVIEASAAGTPSVVVSGPDNAAVDLVEEGVNGYVAPSASPGDLAGAILTVHERGEELRRSCVGWFERNRQRLSLDTSLELVVAAYEAESSVRR